MAPLLGVAVVFGHPPVVELGVAEGAGKKAFCAARYRWDLVEFAQALPSIGIMKMFNSSLSGLADAGTVRDCGCKS